MFQNIVFNSKIKNSNVYITNYIEYSYLVDIIICSGSNKIQKKKVELEKNPVKKVALNENCPSELDIISS